MRILITVATFLMITGSFSSVSFGQLAEDTAELQIRDKTAPASGWAVIAVQQGTEPRPVGSGQGCLRFDMPGGGGARLNAASSLFIGDPLIWVENSAGDISFRIDPIGPEGQILFSFESSVADLGMDGQPFVYIALHVNPDAVPGTVVTMHLDLDDTILYDEAGQPYRVSIRDGKFTVGGLAISCLRPSTGWVQAGQPVTILGAGFRDDVRTDVYFDDRRARATIIDDHTITAIAPMDFLADSVEVKVREQTPGPGGDRAQDIFFSYRFGCLDDLDSPRRARRTQRFGT